ncbi:MAG: hypothetical protein AAF483_12660 [Planctomycetota bacterium]
MPPRNLKERLLHIQEAKRSLGTQVEWLADDEKNSFSKRMGRAPNSEFIVNPEGKIVSSRGWNRPALLRKKLADLVGPADNPTNPADLNLPKPRPAEIAQRGLVPQIELPEDAIEIQVQAAETEFSDPHFVKLRADVSSDLIFAGVGDLYLNFELDPIHRAHWNNLGDPFQLKLEAVDSVELSENEVEGPKLEVEGDADARQFKLAVDDWNPGATIVLKARYILCHDEDGWCKPIEREFRVKNDPAQLTGERIKPQYSERMDEYLQYRDGGIPEPKMEASEEQIAALEGDWSIETEDEFGGERSWELHIWKVDGKLTLWSNLDPSKPVGNILSFDGETLVFLNRWGPFPEKMELKLKGEKVKGTHLSIFGDMDIRGKKLNSQ